MTKEFQDIIETFEFLDDWEVTDSDACFTGRGMLPDESGLSEAFVNETGTTVRR